MKTKPEEIEVMQTITVQVPGLIVSGKFWRKSEKNKDYNLGDFTMRNVAEKEDEEDWWKIWGFGCEVSGNSPENAVKELAYVATMIGEVVGKV